MTSRIAFPDAPAIAGIVDDLGAAYVGEAFSVAQPGVLDENDGWTSLVSIRGPWNGEVVLSGSRAFAVQATSDLMGIAASDVSDDDARDGVSEIANVISGNLKALISESSGEVCKMEVPCALRGQSNFTGMRERQRLWFSWGEQVFCVRVVDAGAPGGGGSGGTPS